MDAHANLIYVSDQDFGTNVLQSDTPVIVDFWASWCGPCRAIAPQFERLSDDYQGKLRFAKIDIDENGNTPTQYGVRAIPTLLVFKGGKEIGRLVGPQPSRLKGEIDRILADNGIPVA